MIIYTYRNYVENVYTYKYDSDGIRTSKTINGVTTNYDIIGTTVLAQYDAENEILFQYNGSTPIGFVLNDVQYLYITNQSGDVRGITDAQGNLIAQYAYDEWGKLLEIDAENEENRAVAEINPLRYRGYYYDNETGLYYLQSRYYNPEWCRFISADGFDYLSTSNHRSSNAYIYCWNNPIVLDDAEGTAPKTSINWASIKAFAQKVTPKIIERLKVNFENFKEKFIATAKKIDFYLQNPDVLIDKILYKYEETTNGVLSRLFGQEIKLKFRIIEAIREQLNDKSEESQNDEIQTYSIIINEDEKTDNWFSVALKILTFGIEIDGITRFFEDLIRTFNPSFDFNNWFRKLGESVQNYIGELFTEFATAMNTIASYLPEKVIDILSNALESWTKGKIIEAIFGETVSSIVDLFNIFKSAKENFDGSHSIDYSFATTFVDIFCLFISLTVPWIVILADMSNEMTEKILYNIENGFIWG